MALQALIVKFDFIKYADSSLAKVEVASSNLVSRSNLSTRISLGRR